MAIRQIKSGKLVFTRKEIGSDSLNDRIEGHFHANRKAGEKTMAMNRGLHQTIRERRIMVLFQKMLPNRDGDARGWHKKRAVS